jgi:hypothetical protein
MILDKNLVLSEGQDIKAISASATAVASTDTAVIGKADFGYKGMFFIVKADEEIKSASANGTVTIKVEASDDSTFASGVSTIFSQSFANFVKSTAKVAKDEVLVKVLLRDVAGLKYVRATYAGDGTWAKAVSGQDTMKVSAFFAFDYPNQ